METVLAYKYRIYPTRSQISRLGNQFSMCRYLYNWNLEERINAYKDHGETISYSQQQNALPGLKEERPWFKSVHFIYPTTWATEYLGGIEIRMCT